MPCADSPETVNLMPRVAAAIEWSRWISALAVLSSLIGTLVIWTVQFFAVFQHKKFSPSWLGYADIVFCWAC
jgi:hypothetical protein